MSHAQMQITRAAEHRRTISRTASARDCVDLVKRYYRTAQARGMDYVEARFWLGASVAQWQLLAKHGDGAVAELATVAGVSQPFLYESLRFFDTFGGEFGAMYEWALGWAKDHGSLLANDVKRLVAANGSRSDLARQVRKHNGATGDDLDLEACAPPGVKPPATTERRQIPPAIRAAAYSVLFDGEDQASSNFEHAGHQYHITITRR